MSAPAGADLENASGGGWTVVWVPASGRPEARSAEGRPWGRVREGVSPSRENFDFLRLKSCIFVHKTLTFAFEKAY